MNRTERRLAGERPRYEVDALTDAGDSVLVAVRRSGRGAASGVRVEERPYHVWDLTKGRAVRFRLFFSESDALRETMSDYLVRELERYGVAVRDRGAARRGRACRPPARDGRYGHFAAGDVRSGSTKRRATAVGEGAMAVQFVHTHLGRSLTRRPASL
jgi:hypothetical protein